MKEFLSVEKVESAHKTEPQISQRLLWLQGYVKCWPRSTVYHVIDKIFHHLGTSIKCVGKLYDKYQWWHNKWKGNLRGKLCA